MSVVIREMTSGEFEAFYRWSAENHAKELMEELQLSHAEAMQETLDELAQMLPKGFQTENHHFFSILAENEHAGYLWTIYEETEGRKQCFLCDFVIWEDKRRKGCGEKALCLVERSAAAAGCQESVLFVRDDNSAARALYKKCGYQILRQEAYGKYMKKLLT